MVLGFGNEPGEKRQIILNIYEDTHRVFFYKSNRKFYYIFINKLLDIHRSLVLNVDDAQLWK